MKKPKMRKMKSGEVGLSKAEFNRWLAAQLREGIKVTSLNSDPTDAFFATEKRMTKGGNLKGVVYVIEN
jgi:hypothetical protein